MSATKPFNTATALCAIAASLLVAACSPSASDSVKAGNQFLAKGDTAAAVVSFKNAIQAEPASREARAGLGEALERSGDLVGAEQQFRKALDAGGDPNEFVPRIAVLLLDRNESAALIREFGKKSLPLAPADGELRGLVALAYLTLNQHEAAGKQLEKADLNARAVHLAKAQLALVGHRGKDAMAELESAVQDGKGTWWVLRAASRVYSATGDQAKALAAMKSAFDQAQWNRGVVGEYAELLVREGRLDEVKPLRERLRKIAPTYYRTVFLDAIFHLREGKLDEAHAAASKVAAALPDHIQANLIAANVELQRHELLAAENRVRKVLARDPNLVEGLRLKFLIDMQRGDRKTAAKALEKALTIAPRDRNLLAASADLAWAKGDRAAAIKRQTDAAHQDPAQARMLMRLAEMQSAMGRKKEAATAVDKAIALVASDPASGDDVFRALLRLRVMDKALAFAQAETAKRPKEPEPFLWQAAVLGSQGNEAAALEQTLRALDVRPDYYPALRALAGTANTPDRAKAYEARLKKAVDAGTRDSRVYSDLAMKMRLAGANAEDVGSMLGRGVAADPSSLAMREMAVQHWLAWGKKDKAIALASEGESSQPDNVAAVVLAASTHAAVGNMEQAQKLYGRLAARFPDRVEWPQRQAQLLASSGKTADAILLLRKTVAAHPDDPSLYRSLAMLQLKEKKGEEALLTANMLRSRPRLGLPGLLLLGDVHAQMDSREKALKAYADAAKAGDAETALLRKVELLDRTGGEALATGDLTKWLASHPDSIPALTLAAQRESRNKNFSAAARHLEAIAKLNPSNPMALNDLAWAYAADKNPAALDTAKKAVALAPANSVILDTLAEAQILAGQQRDAVDTLNRALALNPKAVHPRIRLADMAVTEGNKKRAAELLKEIDPRGLDAETSARLTTVKARL